MQNCAKSHKSNKHSHWQTSGKFTLCLQLRPTSSDDVSDTPEINGKVPIQGVYQDIGNTGNWEGGGAELTA